MLSGDEPMGELPVSLGQQARTAVVRRPCSNNKPERDGDHPEPVALWRDYVAYRDLISRQRAARSPVKASRCSSIGQALPR